jgi:hypothetical protein
VKVTAEAAEKITQVLVRVNGFPEEDEGVYPPSKYWENTLLQKGNYPGENKAVVTVTDDKGTSNDWIKKWS